MSFNAPRAAMVFGASAEIIHHGQFGLGATVRVTFSQVTVSGDRDAVIEIGVEPESVDKFAHLVNSINAIFGARFCARLEGAE